MKSLKKEAVARTPDILVLPRPDRPGDRFRRATRECLLALAAVDAMLEDGSAPREAIAGERTGLLYVTAAAYGASNRAFIERQGGVMHFAYTAPAVVPAEVAIEFGVAGPYGILIGGAPATLRAIEQAARLLEAGTCDRVLVLAVEIFEECADLYARHRRSYRWPLGSRGVPVAGAGRGSGRRRGMARRGQRWGERRGGASRTCATGGRGGRQGRWSCRDAGGGSRRGSTGARKDSTRAVARRETEVVLMTQKEVLDELKGLVVERLKFDPRRAAEMTLETTLPKGIDGSLGLDSLDFIELSVAIEERFGIVIDEAHDPRTSSCRWIRCPASSWPRTARPEGSRPSPGR
jgi:acyl carrier protein